MSILSSISQYHELPEIDLHQSQNITDALQQLEKELFLFFNKGVTCCRVIHGIGEGKLAAAVHSALTKNPLIKEWDEEETGGSCVVNF